MKIFDFSPSLANEREAVSSITTELKRQRDVYEYAKRSREEQQALVRRLQDDPLSIAEASDRTINDAMKELRDAYRAEGRTLAALNEYLAGEADNIEERQEALKIREESADQEETRKEYRQLVADFLASGEKMREQYLRMQQFSKVAERRWPQFKTAGKAKIFKAAGCNFISAIFDRIGDARNGWDNERLNAADFDTSLLHPDDPMRRMALINSGQNPDQAAA